MIEESKPITAAQALELLKGIQTEKAVALASFLKRFIKLSAQQAAELKAKLEALGILKLKEADLVKLIDFLPKDPEDVRKIFAGSEVSLDQNEIEKILEALR